MSVSDADLTLDHKLSELSGRLPLLRLVTPINVADARAAFLAGDEPVFSYRALPDLEEIGHALDELSSNEANDPTIAHLAEGLIRELKLKVEMLSRRNSPDFFLTSVELFGQVEDATLDTAYRVLSLVPEARTNGGRIGATKLAAEALKEIDYYQEQFPELSATVNVSSTITGVMVEAGHLFIASDIKVICSQVYPLLQHEVGTHVVTYENGRAQPLHMLSVGLARYDELQEALGVLAEYLAGGGLPASRLRVLAYRVITAHLRGQNASFREAFMHLTGLGCAKRVAFTTVMRAYRSGGITKDAMYLRGLIRLLDLLEKMDELDLTPLLVGKVSFEALPLVRELLDRSILTTPPLVPRYLVDPEARKRMRKVQQGLDVLELRERSA
ncbi:MAG: tyrosine/phenylalanine carboxypeptidase domain-containing protein [Acidimicrobiia bacterium]